MEPFKEPFMINVLVTTTSFQDTPGKHHALLEAQGWTLKSLRGPLIEKNYCQSLTNMML